MPCRLHAKHVEIDSVTRASTVRWYLAASAIAAICFQVLTVPWHVLTYFIPLLGVLSLPVNLYGFYVAKRYGGWTSRLGRAILLLNVGMIAYNLVGTLVMFWYVSCSNWPILTCDRALGSEENTIWANFLFDIRYPAFALALFFLSAMFNLRGHDFLRWSWVFVTFLGFNLFLALPSPGLEMIVKTYGWAAEEWLNILEWTGNAVIAAYAVVLAVNARKAAGGMFFRPVVTIIFALVCLMAGDILNAPAISDRTHFGVSAGNGPVGLGMLLFAIAFTQLGKFDEKSVSSAP